MTLTAALLAVLATGACRSLSTRAPIAPLSFADADSVATSVVAPGVTHVQVIDGRGPWSIHVLEVEADRCTPLLEARKPGSDLHARATTSAIGGDALAAINADFFILPRGTPVGAHVTNGVVLTGPTDRPIVGVVDPTVSPGAPWQTGTGRMRGHARVRDDSAAITQVNRPATPTSAYRGTTDGLTLYTARIGDAVPADSAARRVVLTMIDGDEAAGRAVVVSADSPAVATGMSAGTAVFLAHGSARDWARRRSPGDTVAWRADVVVVPPEWSSAAPGEGRGAQTAAMAAPVREAVGGFPELLRDGRPVLDQQRVVPAFGVNRHPRTAIGWSGADRLFLVVVDGRQPDASVGMSLDELTWVFQRLGATHAVNLDGGGSSAMVVQGRVVNSPSDREGERAVGNALVLAGCGAVGSRQ